MDYFMTQSNTLSARNSLHLSCAISICSAPAVPTQPINAVAKATPNNVFFIFLSPGGDMKDREEKLQVLTCVISSLFTPTPLCLIVHFLNFICCRRDCPRSSFLNADLDQKRTLPDNSIRDILPSHSN